MDLLIILSGGGGGGESWRRVRGLERRSVRERERARGGVGRGCESERKGLRLRSLKRDKACSVAVRLIKTYMPYSRIRKKL